MNEYRIILNNSEFETLKQKCEFLCLPEPKQVDEMHCVVFVNRPETLYNLGLMVGFDKGINLI